MTSTVYEVPACEKASIRRDQPGDLAVWMLILIEITTFALMFLGFSWVREYDRASFLIGQANLHPIAGLINTISLLTASGFVAQAVSDNRRNQQARAARWLLLGVAAASIYVFVKCWEFWQLGSAGYGLSGNRFFMLYFLLTGFHLLHVLLGVAFLIIMSRKLYRGGYGADNTTGLESGASYWHMIDLIWVVLFPLVYVIR
jgi:nitric oxide reductase NorE protein